MTKMGAHAGPPRPRTLERAYELARSGECAGLNDIKVRLDAERYEDIRGQLFGSTLKLELQRLCNAAREVAPSDRPARARRPVNRKPPASGDAS